MPRLEPETDCARGLAIGLEDINCKAQRTHTYRRSGDDLTRVLRATAARSARSVAILIWTAPRRVPKLASGNKTCGKKWT